jgi:hypothetical protein
MLAAVALSLLLPAAHPVTITTDPPIRLKLSHDEYSRGDRAKVKVKFASDGYLLVLRHDGNGRIRVLYPLDPDDEQKMIRGGKDYEVRSRGDHEAFSVEEASGTGTVVAVRSDERFDFGDFLRNGRWDYRALSDSLSSGDGESVLLDLVDRMTAGRYDYDTATYTVYADDAPRRYAGWYAPWYVGPYYPGFYYGPWFGFRASFGFGHGRGWGRHH